MSSYPYHIVPSGPQVLDAGLLEILYATFNHRRWVSPDPVEFLYGYKDPLEREVVGLIAACLAYGRVTQIHASISLVLSKMEPSPRHYVLEASRRQLAHAFARFRHRFTSGEELASLLYGIRTILERHGSLEACFTYGLAAKSGHTVLEALMRFAAELRSTSGLAHSMLVPDPHAGSALKRLNLFLRWMVRKDRIDPGGWKGVRPSQLIVPLDTHMHRISLYLSLTRRRQPNMQTALEITEAFRTLVPHDPVRYDFALTRLSIMAPTRQHLDSSKVLPLRTLLTSLAPTGRRCRKTASPQAHKEGPQWPKLTSYR